MSNLTNQTITEQSTSAPFVFKVTQTQTNLVVFGFILTMTLTILGNILVLIVLYRQRMNRNIRVTNSFLANLALIDLLMAILVLPFSISINLKRRWSFGDAFCSFNGMITVFVGSASILTMAAISVDRYKAIASASRQRLTLKQAVAMIAGTWIWALAIGLMPVIGWSRYSWSSGSSVCKFSFSQDKGFAFLLGLSCFLLPFLTMLFCYIKVFIVLRRHKKQLDKWTDTKPSSSKVVQASNMKRESRATLIVFVILTIFCLCWIPYVVLSFIMILRPRAIIPSGVFLFSGWTTTAHAAANPIIYIILNTKFRIEAAKLLPCLRCIWRKIGPLEENQSEHRVAKTVTIREQIP